MINRHRRCPHVLLLLAYTTWLSFTLRLILCAAPAPADYLIPPPAPVTHLSAAQPPNLLASESRSVPQHYVPSNGPAPARPAEDPGLINRVARWFGFAPPNYPHDQHTGASGNIKPFYYYHKPQQQQQQHGTGNKEPCGLCNKYPWVPMMFNSIQYNGANPWDLSKQNHPPMHPAHPYVRNNFGPAPAQSQQQVAASVKQRAVQFQYPHPNAYHQANSVPDIQPPHIQYSTGPFLPIPIPNLSSAPLPPLYNAQPFHQTIASTVAPPTTQPLPSTEASRFVENLLSAHSEIRLDSVVPTQIPPSTPIRDSTVEIVKSHQLTDYTSSVEYPASYVPSQTYDVHLSSTQYRPEVKPTVSTGRYQHATFSPQLNQHVPASQILTEPGSFILDDRQPQQPNYNQQQSTLQSEIYEHSTLVYDHQFTGNGQAYELDNYASASIHNSSYVVQPQQFAENSGTWTLKSHDFLYATTTPEVPTSTLVETSTRYDFTTESQLSNDVEFVASIQTAHQSEEIKSRQNLWPERSRDRETPKRFLDSPIQHLSGNLGSPRPFTRDPSDLGLRLVAKNHKFPEPTYQTLSMTAASTTPTSTYSSIDASGHYAGISPSPLTSNTNNENKQIILPFTTKVQPRPFEFTRDSSVTKEPLTDTFSTWSQTQNVDLHTPAESMLVGVKSEVDPPNSPTTAKPHSTKYLTKILATNLKELLQREHANPSKHKQSPNSIGFDLHALQKNIDDWTEQEYTSLSHRPSTPTILGRSKHIPKEYLPSTTASSTTLRPSRQSKTTKEFLDTSELPASINGLEPLYDRSSTKLFHYTPISNNHIQEIADRQAFSTSTTITEQTPTQRSTTTNKPLYMVDMDSQEPEELWRKAKVSISPKTKEKVYVVTPQPRLYSQMENSAAAAATTTSTEAPPNRLGSGFKSPRFLVRPTPGNVTASNLLKILGTADISSQLLDLSNENLSNSYFSHDLFGLKGLSAYVPAEPVEINDGNSKVLKVRTPSSSTTSQNIMDLTKDRHSSSKKKPILAPSPR